MATLSWLHLTDLHRGLDGQRWLWPNLREAFYDDLSRMHDRSGPWDLVLFTGDLTQRGSAPEFELLGALVSDINEHLAALGSRPAWVTVPGNHDLARPDPKHPIAKLMARWHEDPDVQEAFWSEPDSPYRALVRDAFAAYVRFADTLPLPAGAVRSSGVLPGDGSVSLTKDAMRVALVGLNSAFLQLGGGDYLGRLMLDPRQLMGVCTEDPPRWLNDHHAAMLLTHHPRTWLHPHADAKFLDEIAPPGRFVAHLFGHMHVGRSATTSVSGASPRRELQGASLFGLETLGDGNTQRIHGYSVGRIAMRDREITLSQWPRKLVRRAAGGYKLAVDVDYDTDRDDAVTERVVARKALVETPRPLLAAGSGVANSTAAPTPEPLQLSNPQVREATQSLLAAFPTQSSMSMMVRIVLDENLAAISPHELDFAAIDLIRWCQVNGRVGDLLAGASRQNPGNPRLRAFVLSLGLTPATLPSASAPNTAPPSAASDPQVWTIALRQVLCGLYPSPIDVARMLHDAGISRERVNLQGSVQSVWFDALTEAQRAHRVAALVAAARDEYPQHAELLTLQRTMPPALAAVR